MGSCDNGPGPVEERVQGVSQVLYEVGRIQEQLQAISAKMSHLEAVVSDAIPEKLGKHLESAHRDVLAKFDHLDQMLRTSSLGLDASLDCEPEGAERDVVAKLDQLRKPPREASSERDASNDLEPRDAHREPMDAHREPRDAHRDEVTKPDNAKRMAADRGGGLDANIDCEYKAVSSKLGSTMSRRTTTVDFDASNEYPIRAILNEWSLPLCIVHVVIRAVTVWDWYRSLEEPPRTSHLAKIVQSKAFELMSAFVVIANTIVMAFRANFYLENVEGNLEGNAAEIDIDTTFYDAVDFFFLGYYSMEIALKAAVHRAYLFVGSEVSWNVVDLCLVILAVYDKAITSIAGLTGGSNPTFLRAARILKLVKPLRVVRVIRAFNELRVILASIIGTMISLLWSLVMIIFILYMFSLAMVSRLTDFMLEEGSNLDSKLRSDIMDQFGGVDVGMITMFKAMTGGNDWDLYYTTLVQTGRVNSGGFLFIIFFIQVSFLNILTGIFVEKALKIAQPDRGVMAKDIREKDELDAAALTLIVRDIDEAGEGYITREKFTSYFRQAHGAKILSHFAVSGIAIKSPATFFKVVAAMLDRDEISIAQFVGCCMRLRGEASQVEVQRLVAYSESSIKRLEQFMGQVDEGSKAMSIVQKQNQTIERMSVLLQKIHSQSQNMSIGIRKYTEETEEAIKTSQSISMLVDSVRKDIQEHQGSLQRHKDSLESAMQNMSISRQYPVHSAAQSMASEPIYRSSTSPGRRIRNPILAALAQ
eukprot:CAMPEP_0117483510 /NCGR_PEP_ID=MMETSP0784-20121206/13974_1 /TAXON_ID=39447 /ORGANISM="" /LENGTH=759 /DNA_ID=CAMNT_0005278043 /DNA_START=194 /DNA_END=2473 /DNA_ORIENTATION=+